MRIIYIANDGKKFDDELECERYEWILNHPHLKSVKCYDKEGKELKDIMEEDTYNYCHKIIAPTDESVEELNDLAHYTGYCYYSHVTEVGTWVFNENGIDGRFVKVSD